MYKVIIADDEDCAIEALEQLLVYFSNYSIIKTITDPSEIIPAIVELQPDLVLLDICMNKLSGIEVMKEVKALAIPLQIIFVTAYPEYAVEAFECNACDFLIKPVTMPRLSKALSHFERHNKTNMHSSDSPAKNEILRFNTKQGFILIKTHDIVCLEADQVYTSIRTIENRTLLVSQNIGKIEQLLPEDNFIRVSRSAIVNMSFISEICRKSKNCTLRWDSKSYIIKLSKSGIDRLDLSYNK